MDDRPNVFMESRLNFLLVQIIQQCGEFDNLIARHCIATCSFKVEHEEVSKRSHPEATSGKVPPI